MDVQESKIHAFVVCSLARSCTCLCSKLKQRTKTVAGCVTVWVLAGGDAPLEALDMHVSHHVCGLDGPSPVSLCRLEIKPLVHLGHPLIVATVERYKIRAHGVLFFLPSGVSDLKKKEKRERSEKKSNPDGRMIGSVLMDTQWTIVSQSFRGWWRLHWVFLVTVTVAFDWCRYWKIWKNMSGSNFIIFAFSYSRKEAGFSCSASTSSRKGRENVWTWNQ